MAANGDSNWGGAVQFLLGQSPKRRPETCSTAASGTRRGAGAARESRASARAYVVSCRCPVARRDQYVERCGKGDFPRVLVSARIRFLPGPLAFALTGLAEPGRGCR